MAHLVKRGISVVTTSKDNRATIIRKGKAFDTTNLDAPLSKWLFENGDKALDMKLAQRNEKITRTLQSRPDTEVSERTTEEFDNSTLRKLSSQIELMSDRLNSLEHSVKRISRKSGTTPIKYRKNRRVTYIRKTRINEEVLKRLREHENEELKITIEKVFRKAAQQLGLLNEN
ncbi:MAG: hypothetical protein QXR63_00710 [Candidatus Bathyarchaeia archaeon]